MIGRAGVVAFDDDLAAAFRARVLRDWNNILDHARVLTIPTDWKRGSVPVAELERLAHGLAGASLMFGHPALGEAAARLERLLGRWRAEAPERLSRQRLTALRRRLAPLLVELAAASDGPRRGHRRARALKR